MKRDFRNQYARTRARANDFGFHRPQLVPECAHSSFRSADRVVCGARRRRDGQPCTALSVPGRRRCKWHGGMSTGPRSRKGKAKCEGVLDFV